MAKSLCIVVEKKLVKTCRPRCWDATFCHDGYASNHQVRTYQISMIYQAPKGGFPNLGNTINSRITKRNIRYQPHSTSKRWLPILNLGNLPNKIQFPDGIFQATFRCDASGGFIILLVVLPAWRRSLGVKGCLGFFRIYVV